MRIKFLYVNHAFKEINIKKTSIKKRAIELFGVVHFDICGPLQTWTHLGYIYFITFIDDLSKCCYVYPIRHNTRAFDKFPYYKNFAEKQTNHKLKVLWFDRGGEHKSNEFNTFCKQEGIQREFTCAYTPQQNGVLERKHKTLVNIVLAMLSHDKLPKVFWGEALLNNESSTQPFFQNGPHK